MQADEMVSKLVKGLEKKYGKPLAHWVKLAQASSLTKHKEILEFMKSEHGFSYGHANLIAFKALGTDAASIGGDGDILTLAFKGKEHWLPLYQKILTELKDLNGMEIAPKKSYVSLRRAKQFAILQPSTKSRFDVGLKFSTIEAEQRLEEAGKWNSMVTHRVRLGDINEVNAQLVSWLRTAYEQAG